ncbi:hypothetical protein DFH09DRAFT_1469065 [Mycena vulgaris]|nr:hypothetical protein DFH09DRAFT_1469065 [Mycena vulgaris]
MTRFKKYGNSSSALTLSDPSFCSERHRSKSSPSISFKRNLRARTASTRPKSTETFPEHEDLVMLEARRAGPACGIPSDLSTMQLSRESLRNSSSAVDLQLNKSLEALSMDGDSSPFESTSPYESDLLKRGRVQSMTDDIESIEALPPSKRRKLTLFIPNPHPFALAAPLESARNKLGPASEASSLSEYPSSKRESVAPQKLMIRISRQAVIRTLQEAQSQDLPRKTGIQQITDLSDADSRSPVLSDDSTMLDEECTETVNHGQKLRIKIRVIQKKPGRKNANMQKDIHPGSYGPGVPGQGPHTRRGSGSTHARLNFAQQCSSASGMRSGTLKQCMPFLPLLRYTYVPDARTATAGKMPCAAIKRGRIASNVDRMRRTDSRR